jgi:anti-sigma factor RsiW
MSEIAERCAPFEADLSALLDDQLDATRAGDVQAHAESCRDCALRLAALRAVDGELRRAAAVPVDPVRIEALRSALASRLRAEASGDVRAPIARRAAPHRRRWLAPVALIATAAAAAALLLVMRPNAPVVAPASEVVVTPQAAQKSRSDAEVAARELAAGIDTPIGANTPSDEVTPTATQRESASGEALDPMAAFAELPPQTRERLREKLATLEPEERSELLLRLSQRQQLSPQQRSELRESLSRLGVLSPEEQERTLR